jgi:putative DNA primase/helicase
MEVDEGSRLAEALIKMVTGGDTIRARHLYQGSFEFVPQFKLWLAANHSPLVRADDSAIWRRIIRIPFESVIARERRDATLKARLKDPNECRAILAWGVSGCLRWQKEGLRIPAIVDRATERYRSDIDPFWKFIADACVRNPDAWTPSSELHRTYQQWAQAVGQPAHCDDRKLAAALRSADCIEQFRREGGQPKRGWRGIGLRSLSPQANDAVTRVTASMDSFSTEARMGRLH